MARPEVTGRKIGSAKVRKAKTATADDDEEDADADAFSVAEFCRRHRISVQMFYKHRDQMPATFNVGVRRLISKKTAAAWRRQREEAAA